MSSIQKKLMRQMSIMYEYRNFVTLANVETTANIHTYVCRPKISSVWCRKAPTHIFSTFFWLLLIYCRKVYTNQSKRKFRKNMRFSTFLYETTDMRFFASILTFYLIENKPHYNIQFFFFFARNSFAENKLLSIAFSKTCTPQCQFKQKVGVFALLKALG